LRINYLLAEDDIPGEAPYYTVFHLLRTSETMLLRCFMALLYFPASLNEIVTEKGPFVEALKRLRDVPTLTKASSGTPLPEQMKRDLIDLPLLVLIVGKKIPVWLEDLATARPIALLSPDETVVEAALQMKHVSAGLLQGLEDVREFYRTFCDLCRKRSQDHRLNDETRKRLTFLGELDLLARRSRLDFFPALPLPQPWEGRAAAYLLNRLSNNVERPSLEPDSREGSGITLPKILVMSSRAVTALALFELGQQIPAAMKLSQKEVEEAHTTLLSTCDPDQKFAIMLELGRRMTNTSLENLFITAPVVRVDLVRGRVPKSVKPNPKYKLMAKSGIQAVTDFIKKAERNDLGAIQDKQAYDQARATLLLEQRFLACQTAFLASRSGSVPLQLRPLPGEIYSKLRDLNQALEVNSRKSSRLFREVERGLGNLLPSAVQDSLRKGDSSIIFFSDLPFEWAMVDEWPLCLTRPVSRIPIGMTHWDVLSAIIEEPVVIDTRMPERVLVLDLIGKDDPIRYYSDLFASVSSALEQNYTYAHPADATEFRKLIEQLEPTIVVLDTHGRYDRPKDEIWISLPKGQTSVDQLLSDVRVPPVWILSACDASVTGAMRGCFVRQLLARGAVCVIASLARVDAFTASVFVGRLLTDIFNPIQRGSHQSLERVFFFAQLMTALLYDPLLPLIRKFEKDASLKQQLGRVLGDYLSWVAQTSLDARQFRYAAAWTLGETMARHGLTKMYMNAQLAGNVRPETLLFSAFGVPSHVLFST
jgi:CHAT domain